VKSSVKPAPVQILFPGAQAWELWIFDPAEGGAGSCHAGLEAPAFRNGGERRVLALPVASTYAIPLWVMASHPDELRGAADLHLEKDGLKREEEPEGFDFEQILASEGRSLIRVDGLAPLVLPFDGASAAPDSVCLAPNLLRHADDRIVIWRELGRLVTAMSRGGKLVYHNVLASSVLDARAVEEVVRWAKQFQFQGMVNPCQGIVVWGDDVETDPSLVERGTGLPVIREARPAPCFNPEKISAIRPRFVAEIQARAARKRRISRWLGAAALLAGGAVVAYVVALALALQNQKQWRDRIAVLSPAAADIEQVQQRWEEVAAAVDPDQSPLEIMLRIRQIPDSGGITLVRFERTAERIAIKGRAASPPEALKFLGAISKSEGLSGLDWTYTQPVIAEDGTATFEIEGITKSVDP
jgi:hypothetical protein